MTSRGDTALLIGFAAVQTVGAIVAIVAYFVAPSTAVWIRLVWLLLAIAVVGAGMRWLVDAQRRPGDQHADAEPGRVAAPALHGQWPPDTLHRIHCFVPLTMWSALASLVVRYMSNHRTAFLLVALAPLWVTIIALGAMRFTAHRASMIAMTVLCCGLFGAWLGSDGDSAARLGFCWYALAGYIIARVLVSRDPMVSVFAAVVCTVLFVSLTVVIIGREFVYPMTNPSPHIRTGSQFFAFEVYLVLSGRWILRTWSTMRANRDGRVQKQLPA